MAAVEPAPVPRAVHRRWRRRALWIGGLALVAVLARATVLRRHPVPVTVFRVERGTVEESVANSKAGTIKSRQRASLSPEVGGRVLAIPVKKGERVRAGQVLLRIADADVQAQVAVQEHALRAARAGVQEACRAARQAEKDLARNRELAREKIISPDLLDQLQSRRDVTAAACSGAQARLRQAESSLEAARVNLEKTTLRAPFDGVVAEISAEVGEWITPSPPAIPIPPVIELIDDRAIYVSAPMDEVDIGKVKTGQTARITLDSYPGRPFPGRVTRIAPYVADVQEQNRTFEIEAEFDDSAFARRLPPGTSADVEVILSRRDNVLRIPSSALLEGGNVLVVRRDRLESRPVRVGLLNWAYAEILEGLKTGDPVVVSLDRAEVKEGARVRIVPEKRS